MPGHWTRAAWLAATDAKKGFSNYERSPALLALDAAIHGYDTASDMHRPRALAQMRTAYDAWAGGKLDPSATIRNRNRAVTDFEEWLLKREVESMPIKETGWRGLANCYAYAMKCRTPGGGGTPVPGRAAGVAVVPYHPNYGGSLALYCRELMAGIVADGAAVNLVVQIHSQPAATGQMPQPDQPPIHLAGGQTYLVAMIANLAGFHFLRRDSTTGLWSHKNGAQTSEVETYTTLTANRRPMVLDDATFVGMVRQGQGVYDRGLANFAFAGYLLVPDAGFPVS